MEYTQTDRKQELLRNFRSWQTKKQCAGSCGSVRITFVNFSCIAEPLTQLMKSDVPFKWEALQREAFRELQRCLHSQTVLEHFDENAETEIHMDTSSVRFRRSSRAEERPAKGS